MFLFLGGSLPPETIISQTFVRVNNYLHKSLCFTWNNPLKLINVVFLKHFYPGYAVAGLDLKRYAFADPSTPYRARFTGNREAGEYNPLENGFYSITTYFQLVQVPEPATYALCGATLVALAAIKHKRRLARS